MVIFLILTFLDILIYRIFQKNIIFSLKSFIIIFLVFINFLEIDFLLINILLFYFLFSIFYILVFTGIRNTSPSLFIIHHLINNNKSKKFGIKKNFLKKKFTKKRLEENLKKNLINKKQKRILISEKGRLFICVFFNLKKIFNL